MVINIAGFSVRFAQLLLSIPIILFIIYVLIKGKIKKPIGYKYLIVWFIFIVLFTPNTTFLTRNISYDIWMFFNILLIFSAVHFINNENKLIYIYKMYLYSFIFVGVFGLLQFGLSLLHMPNPLVTQYWPNGMARINGFSYEPSYYATYMIMGQVISMYLKVNRSNIVSNKFINFMFFICSMALVLSSSRMGILLVAMWVFGYFLGFVKYLIKGKLHIGYLKILSIFFIVFIAIATTVLFDKSGKTDFLLQGTGLKGTAAGSVDIRGSQLSETIKVFENSPFIGYSLGGIPSARAKLHGITITNQDEAKQFEGMNIFAEVLAASGIIGFIPFVIYIGSIIIRPYRLAKSLVKGIQRDILMSFVLSLIAILMLLQFNQNILRLYLWFHIALLSSAYSIIRKHKYNKVINEVANKTS